MFTILDGSTRKRRRAEQRRAAQRAAWDDAKSQLGLSTDQELSQVIQAQLAREQQAKTVVAQREEEVAADRATEVARLQTDAQAAYDCVHRVQVAAFIEGRAKTEAERKEFDAARLALVTATDGLRRLGIEPAMSLPVPQLSAPIELSLSGSSRRPAKPTGRARRAVPCSSELLELVTKWRASGAQRFGAQFEAVRSAVESATAAL